MLKFIFSCLYFFLPAYFTNMTPPLAKRVKVLNSLAKPIDFNKKFLGKPILGSHKTWRGAVLGITIGMTVAFLQFFLYRFNFFKELSILNYQKIDILLFAFLIAFGDIFGDLMFAFIKRRIGLKPGAPFLPFDQTNYVIGNFLILTPFFKIDILVWITLFFLTFFLHIIFNRLGYLLSLHDSKW